MNYFVSSRKSTEGTEMSWDVGCVILSNIPSHCFFFFFFFYVSMSYFQERKKLSTSLTIRGINAPERSVQP